MLCIPNGPATLRPVEGMIVYDIVRSGLIYYTGTRWRPMEGELFTKANADLKAKYSAQGCHPFSYAKGDGKITEMNYMSVDESSLEDLRTIKIRFEEALDLALQAPVKSARKTNNKAKAEINNAK